MDIDEVAYIKDNFDEISLNLKNTDLFKKGEYISALLKNKKKYYFVICSDGNSTKYGDYVYGLFEGPCISEIIFLESGKNITNISSLFLKCFNLSNLNIVRLNTSNVENMSYMFYYCISLNKVDFPKFDTRKVVNMSNIFSCSKVTKFRFVKFFN